MPEIEKSNGCLHEKKANRESFSSHQRETVRTIGLTS